MNSELIQILQEAKRLEEKIDRYNPGETTSEEAEFRELFFATDPDEAVLELKKQLEKCTAALAKFNLEQEYNALRREKEHMTSASVRLVLLMQSMKAKGADVLTAKLQADGAKDYAQRVQRLSEKAADKEALREKFAVQKKGSTLRIGNVKVGSIIRFGHYPQTANGNDNTPIEWQVLKTDGKTALCIAKYGLDCKQFHHLRIDITWEKCDLREWLNGEFLQKAFSRREQEAVLLTPVNPDTNPDYSSTPQGNATKDKVFLLSVMEANKYFINEGGRCTKPTAFAVRQGAYTASNDGCWWWLRSSGFSSYYTANVYGDGLICSYGGSVNRGYGTVRPVVLLQLY